ncbi:MAG: hypothetical protein BGO43_02335 [Gammaproteobacteria bacterium 39-13]|nr:MAG: hypothetical protein BGO43_02335 [Gammaproteobacteria bacterium 39-13]
MHNIANDKGLVCTALIPVNPEPDQPLDVKVLFRGTHSGASAIVDLETTGAGSKTMRDNRIKLLNEVNSIVGNLQEKHPGTPVSLSIHGHSLGGSFAERFTSEVHQAIFHQNNHGVDPVVIATAAENQDLFTDAPKQRQRMVDNLQSRIALNNKEMEGKNYSALASLSGITTTAANSARLTSKEARVGEGFIALNQELNQPPQKQKLNYFKAGGDWVSQAGNRSLGSGFSAKSDVDVALLRKRADYGGITAVHPILGHCDHPLMRYHDKSQRDVNFDYHTQKKEPELLKKGLTSGRVLPQAAQKLYSKMPTALAEPITWVKRQHAKLMGKDATQVKGMEIKTQAEKEQKKAEKAQRKKP